MTIDKTMHHQEALGTPVDLNRIRHSTGFKLTNDGKHIRSIQHYLSSTFRISRDVAESLGDSSEEAGRDFDGFGVMPGHP